MTLAKEHMSRDMLVCVIKSSAAVAESHVKSRMHAEDASMLRTLSCTLMRPLQGVIR